MVDEYQIKAAYDKGFRIGFAKAVLERLTNFLGTVPESLTKRLERLSIEALKSLSDVLLTFGSYDDVDRWLKRVEEKRRIAQMSPVERAYERGLEEAFRRSLLRQMTRLFGDAPANLTTDLQRLSADSLDALDLALPDLHTYVDVENWLACRS